MESIELAHLLIALYDYNFKSISIIIAIIHCCNLFQLQSSHLYFLFYLNTRDLQ